MLKNINREQLIARLKADYPAMGSRWVEAQADKTAAETDDRLEPNVAEYLNNLPLSEILIGDYSVAMVMRMNPWTGFWKAIQKLSVYAKDPVRGAAMIHETRR